jgi:hypothetical protein
MVASDTPYTSAGADLPLMVHVTAPATLPAGYTFEAEINGDPSKLFTCEVVRCAPVVVISSFVVGSFTSLTFVIHPPY